MPACGAVSIHPDDLRRAFDIWWTDEYRLLELRGLLANIFPSWEATTFAKPLEAAVRDPDAVPCAQRSEDPVMQDVLEREWPHHEVLAAIDPTGAHSCLFSVRDHVRDE